MATAPASFAKETDGFFARHFDRRISGSISRLLIHTPVTPNQITVAVTGLGIVAGVAMANAGYWPKVAGALLFLATSILDGCDGEVARAKHMTSRLGGWLDLWGDNVVHVAVFYGLGAGLYKDTGRPVYLWLGAAAVVGTVISAALASVQTYFKIRRSGVRADQGLFTSVVGDAGRLRSAPPWERRLASLSDALARRDFVYGVVFLAFINHLEIFLWPCAIGANIYAVVLILLLGLARQ